jgi:holo-[acyl-carrier protein] synthase
MLKGVGSDIIEIARIRSNILKYGDRFLNKILTPQERDYCLNFKDPAPSVAGRFSAKEAIAKALGTGFGDFLEFQDIEVLNEATGRPYVLLSEKANQFFKNPRFLLTISHCKSHAIAFAVVS